MPVVEAMAAGVPAIVSTCTSLPEVVGDAAMLCEPDDIINISDAMERLLTDREFHKRLRVQGQLRAAGFSWDSSVSKLSSIVDLL